MKNEKFPSDLQESCNNITEIIEEYLIGGNKLSTDDANKFDYSLSLIKEVFDRDISELKNLMNSELSIESLTEKDARGDLSQVDATTNYIKFKKQNKEIQQQIDEMSNLLIQMSNREQE